MQRCSRAAAPRATMHRGRADMGDDGPRRRSWCRCRPRPRPPAAGRPRCGARSAAARSRRIIGCDGRPGRERPSPVLGARSADAKNPGDDLFSRKAALSVSSALESLTSVFGMGTGVASPLESPGFLASGCGSAAADARRCATGAGRSMISIFDLDVSHDGCDPGSQPLTPGQLLKRSSPRPLVPLSFIRHRTSTCRPIKQVVSLRSYPVDPVGNLILRRASRLDAFSAYPDRT